MHMKIWNDCKSLWKDQKGAYLVLVASLLPLLFGFAGLAVDLGNFHAHTAKLQHASDAAALAGAAIYAANEETEDSHPLADEAAETYLKANLGSAGFGSLVDDSDEIRYQVKTSGDVSYFRVYIEENLNTSFIRLIGAPFFTYPAGEAFATIPSSGGGGKGGAEVSFDNLISFDGELWGHFNMHEGRRIQSTFDGNIYCYSYWGPWDHEGHWGHWEDWDGHYRFYTSDAKGMSFREADQKGYYTDVQRGDPNSYNKATNETDKALEKLFSNETSVVYPNTREYTLPNNSSTSDYYYIKTNSRDFDLNLYNFSGDQNTPVYVYVDGHVDHVTVTLKENITRPIIFCYTGGYRWGRDGGRGWVTFRSNGKDFRGVIYTPHADYTYVDFDQGTFKGSLVAHNLDLDSRNGTFIYEKFGVGGSGSSSGSGSSGGSSSGDSGGSSGTNVELKLVPDPGLDWES